MDKVLFVVSVMFIVYGGFKVLFTYGVQNAIIAAGGKPKDVDANFYFGLAFIAIGLIWLQL